MRDFLIKVCRYAYQKLFLRYAIYSFYTCMDNGQISFAGGTTLYTNNFPYSQLITNIRKETGCVHATIVWYKNISKSEYLNLCKEFASLNMTIVQGAVEEVEKQTPKEHRILQ